MATLRGISPLAFLAPPRQVSVDEASAAVARVCPAAEVLPAAAPGELRWRVPDLALAGVLRTLATDLEARLFTHVAHGARLVVTLAPDPGPLLTLEAEGALPALLPVLPAAGWCDREARDLGLALAGVDPRPLLRPSGLSALPVQPGLARFSHGPIHDGIDGSAVIHFNNDGELMRGVEPELFHDHRGVERLAEGRSPDDVLALAERLCSACAVAHALSLCSASERAAGADVEASVPPRARALRTLLAEVERMLGHTRDLGVILAGLGVHQGGAQLALLEHELREVAALLTGSRMLFGALRVGGVTRDLPAGGRDLARRLRRVGRKLGLLWDRVGETPAAVDRADGLGTVPRARALDLGLVGVAARACRIPRDARKDRPYAHYGEVDFKLSLSDRGDVVGRSRVRIDELREAVAIACQCIDGLPEGPLAVEVPAPAPGAVAHGWAESARGETVTWVAFGSDGRLARWRVRSASYFNWAALPAALADAADTSSAVGALASDLPLVRRSLGLCTACVDR